MSYFSTALTRLAERNDLKQADFVRKAGLTRSHVSRLFNADQRNITDEDLAAVLKVFSNVVDRAELVAARCMDARTGPGSELVDISVKTAETASAAGAEPPTVALPSETEKAFAWLRSQCPLNPDLERHLVGYARLTGMN